MGSRLFIIGNSFWGLDWFGFLLLDLSWLGSLLLWLLLLDLLLGLLLGLFLFWLLLILILGFTLGFALRLALALGFFFGLLLFFLLLGIRFLLDNGNWLLLFLLGLNLGWFGLWLLDFGWLSFSFLGLYWLGSLWLFGIWLSFFGRVGLLLGKNTSKTVGGPSLISSQSSACIR